MKRSKILFASCAAALSATACSPETETRAQNQVAESSGPSLQQAHANQSAEPAPSRAEPLAAKPAAAASRRCGWLQNPTPGNWWLVDRDGEWLLGAQGGYQAPGMDGMPDMSAVEWTEVNGHYGYGCACMDVVTDPASRRVLKLESAAPRPLAQCRADRRLPKPGMD